MVKETKDIFKKYSYDKSKHARRKIRDLVQNPTTT